MDADRLARFWASVDKSGPIQQHCPEIGNCWKWRNVTGWYGHFSPEKGKRLYAHRVSWELHNGPIATGLCVLHKCDNPECVRPDHLFLGTHKDNSEDRSRKGRANWKSDHELRIHPEKIARGPELSERHRRNGIIRNIGEVKRGSQSPQAKLTEEDILKIHDLRVSGVGSQKIAEQFSVSRSLIQQTLRGDTWKHVKRELFAGPKRGPLNQARQSSSRRSDSPVK